MTHSKQLPRTRGWDTYWRGASGAGAYASGGVSHPRIVSFWDEVLTELPESVGEIRVLDIATGSGAIVERLVRRFGPERCKITCLDLSAAAVDSVRSRFPGTVGLVADANSIPLEDCVCDLVTSQFGVEYAGSAALGEAARLLAPGGSLILMLHIRPGMIFDECAAARAAVQRTRQSKFVPLAHSFFEAGFAAVRGADRAPYEQAGADLNPAVAEVESVLTEFGQQVAGGTIAKLYADVQTIHTRIQHYQPEEVLGWLRAMDTELADYEQRMASMCESAIDAQRFDQVRDHLEARGLSIISARPLMTDDAALPIAWVLRAVKPRQST